jgi:DHA1 family tetracycline resistance protein-like MFS transporter
MLIVAPVIALVPFALPFGVHLLGVVLLGFGSGLATPSLSSLVSRTTPQTMQGGIFGVTQGLGAFARIISPLIANSLYDIRYFFPYLLAGVCILVPAIGAWFLKPAESIGGDPDAEPGVVAA